VLHALPISSSSTSFWLCLAKSINYEDLNMQFCPTSCYFVPLWSKYSPQQHFLKYFQSWSSPNVRDQVSNLYKTKRKNYNFVYSDFYFFKEQANCSKHYPNSAATYLLPELNLIRHCRSKICELCHILYGSTSYLHVTVLPCIVLMRNQYIFSFLSAYISRTTCLLAPIRIYVFLS
jgi:hypothetical protein